MPDDYHHLIGYMREHGIAAWHRHPLTWEGDIAEANDDAARDEAYSQLEETAGKQECNHCHHQEHTQTCRHPVSGTAANAGATAEATVEFICGCPPPSLV